MRMRIVKRQTRCYICGKQMTSLCDATKKDGTPCDMPMCDEHRVRIATDLDVCKYHNYPKYIEQARENRIMREEAKLYFIEEYQKQDFRVVPGHWPDFATKEEVDKWIEFQKSLMEANNELFEEDDDV